MSGVTPPTAPGKGSLTARPWALLLLVLLLGGCAQGAISGRDLAGEPTVYATLVKDPDPLLLGCHMRPRPSDYHRPNSYSYCLVRKGDKYAVYYHWRDGKTLAEHAGWRAFTIDGARLISETDPSVYRVKDGKVWHEYAGHGTPYPMIPY